MIIVDPREDVKGDANGPRSALPVEDDQDLEQVGPSTLEEQPPPYVASEEHPLLGSPKEVTHRTRRRFFRALVVAYGVFIVIAVSTRIMVFLLARPQWSKWVSLVRFS